ncbi:hypothetical protein CD006_00645 [Enterobacter sp. 10-1]|nr:hypothetical protein [Raoultella sp. 10-1]PAC13762.1 hypothetical protein CD006_00645 [Enterobacter sp. 10-1]
MQSPKAAFAAFSISGIRLLYSFFPLAIVALLSTKKENTA